MTFYSPLRYPGGKNRLKKFISKVCYENNIKSLYVEPYAGGCAVGLYLLMENKVEKLIINDYDFAIYSFWYSILNNCDDFCDLIKKTPINLYEWTKQKEIYKEEKKDMLKLGFSTFFLNRTNFSGVICGGPLGGKKQNGKYKIDCRFNKKQLIQKIKNIQKYKDKIKLFNLDALELIEKVDKIEKDKLVYMDPPYFNKGSSLYLNYYTEREHTQLSLKIKKLNNTNWIISYDNTPEILKIFSWIGKEKTKFFSLNHSIFSSREGKEVLFRSENLNLPKEILN